MIVFMPNMMPALTSAVTVISSRGAYECKREVSEAILRILKKEGSLSFAEITARMQMPEPTVKAHLTVLIKDGYVKRGNDGIHSIYSYVKH